MTCANILSFPGVDMAFGLYRSSPALSHRLGLHPPPKAPGRVKASKPGVKRVVFADSKGLSLTSVCVFSKREEKLTLPFPRLRKLSPATTTEDGGATPQRPNLRLGFAQPCADFQDFRRRLRESAVLLESCYVAERAILGTVRVRNVSYEKAVHVRVTFDSWRTHRDVPCSFLRQLYGEPDTDMFAFEVALPGRLDSRERVEFCVSYRPGGYENPVWDNNHGQNYSIRVSD